MPGYYCGFSNMKMSLDIAIVLAHLTDRVLVPYRFRLPRRVPTEPGRILEPLLVPDLFEIPVPWSDEYVRKTWISAPAALPCSWPPLFESVFCSLGTGPTDDEDFRRFRNGRAHVLILTRQQDEAPDLHVTTHALGHYSYFFYLDEARRRRVVDLMKRVRPKRPYREAADRIAAMFGSFNAIHLRRGTSPRTIWRREVLACRVHQWAREIVANRVANEPDDPLVVSYRRLVLRRDLRPIQKHFARPCSWIGFERMPPSARSSPGCHETTRAPWRSSPSWWRARRRSLRARCSARSPR
jgi:hypothetical protein